MIIATKRRKGERGEREERKEKREEETEKKKEEKRLTIDQNYFPSEFAFVFEIRNEAGAVETQRKS